MLGKQIADTARAVSRRRESSRRKDPRDAAISKGSPEANGKKTILGVSCQCVLGSRKIQQDALGGTNYPEVNDVGALFVLSDGMGGMNDGEKYSSIATTEMKKAFDLLKTSEKDSSMETILSECYMQARKKALEFRETMPMDGGATVIALMIRGQQCTFLSVGDSRIYLYRNRALITLNREQTTGVQLDINAAFGYIPDEYRSMFTRDTLENNLCEAEEKPYDMPVAPFELVDQDCLLMMSDGLYRALSDCEMQTFLTEHDQEGMNLDQEKQLAGLLCNAAIQKNIPDQDNCSAIVIKVHIVKQY